MSTIFLCSSRVSFPRIIAVIICMVKADQHNVVINSDALQKQLQIDFVSVTVSSLE